MDCPGKSSTVEKNFLIHNFVDSEKSEQTYFHLENKNLTMPKEINKGKYLA